MGLLPPALQDKTGFQPLGKAIKKPEPKKPDPIREFEKQNHDIPVPFPAFDAFYARQQDRLNRLDELGRKQTIAIQKSPLSWPMIEGLPEATFLPEVVNPAPTDEEVEEWKVQRRQRGAMLVSHIDFYLTYNLKVRISPDDADAVDCFFGDFGLPEKWRGRVISDENVDNLP